MVNMPNVEDIGIYSQNMDNIAESEPGKIVTEISTMLFDILEAEKLKGEGISVNDLAMEIDKQIEQYSQGLIYSNSDYFIIKEFHSYVIINEKNAAIIFVKKPGDKNYEKDLETLERIKYTTRRVISSIFHNDLNARELYEEQHEAVLYLYGYNIINKKTPLALYFPGISFEDWLAKFGKTPNDYGYLYPDIGVEEYLFNNQDRYVIDDWDEVFDDDEIEEASYGDYEDEDDYDDEDGDDEEDDDDESDLPPLPWN